jgi:hypothetical protein
LKSLWVWIGGNLVGNGEVLFDTENFHRPSLSEQNRETDILKSLAINKFDKKLHELRIWQTIDLDALERP